MSESQPQAAAEPSPKSRRYPKDFQQDAVRLVTEQHYTFKAAAQAVGVSEKSLRDWHKKFAPPPVPCGEDATVAELQVENKRLRKALKRAELEREILKKATAYFAKESLCPFTGNGVPGSMNIATRFPSR